MWIKNDLKRLILMKILQKLMNMLSIIKSVIWLKRRLIEINLSDNSQVLIIKL